ncbi:MAG TPA: hypothetical protein VFH66_11970 [Mycobacteriales bacterium]|nr:hypothetical protein [Mycobacteriales bacterium]
MSPPTLWWRPTAIVGVLMVAAVTCLLARLVLEAADDSLPVVATLLVTYVVMRVAAIAEPAETLGLVISMAALMTIQRDIAASRKITVSVFGSACAVALLVKFDAGVEAALAAMAASWWIGWRRWRSLGQFVATLGLSLIVIWLCIGQNVNDVPVWLVRSWEAAAGYTVAMAAYLPTHETEVAVALFFIPTIALAAKWSSRRRLLGAAAVAAVVVYFQVKHGTVRYQVGGTYLAGVVLPVVIAWQWRARAVAFVLPAALLTYLFTLAPPAHLSRLTMSPTATAQEFFTQASDLASHSRSRRLESTTRVALAQYLDVSPKILSAVRGHRVFVDPYEVSAAWAYQFRWQPVPVFQRFSAYLPSLDAANTAFLLSPEGPDVILRQRKRGAIDGRNLLWDSPAMTLAMSCNFAITVQDRHWQVWSRVAQRCGPPELIDRVTAQPDHAVTVPAPTQADTLVFARVAIPSSLGSRLVATLYKPVCPAILATDDRRYRLVPATADDGLILGEPPTAPFGSVQLPHTLTFHCMPGSPVRIDFYAMRYEARALPKTRSRGERAAARRHGANLLNSPPN